MSSLLWFQESFSFLLRELFPFPSSNLVYFLLVCHFESRRLRHLASISSSSLFIYLFIFFSCLSTPSFHTHLNFLHMVHLLHFLPYHPPFPLKQILDIARLDPNWDFNFKVSISSENLRSDFCLGKVFHFWVLLGTQCVLWTHLGLQTTMEVASKRTRGGMLLFVGD